jgi:hypothetical protein
MWKERRNGHIMISKQQPTYYDEKNGLQQFQIESCQPIKRVRDNNNNNNNNNNNKKKKKKKKNKNKKKKK